MLLLELEYNSQQLHSQRDYICLNQKIKSIRKIILPTMRIRPICYLMSWANCHHISRSSDMMKQNLSCISNGRMSNATNFTKVNTSSSSFNNCTTMWLSNSTKKKKGNSIIETTTCNPTSITWISTPLWFLKCANTTLTLRRVPSRTTWQCQALLKGKAHPTWTSWSCPSFFIHTSLQYRPLSSPSSQHPQTQLKPPKFTLHAATVVNQRGHYQNRNPQINPPTTPLFCQ